MSFQNDRPIEFRDANSYYSSVAASFSGEKFQYNEHNDAWVVNSFSLCRQILGSPSFGKSKLTLPSGEEAHEAALREAQALTVAQLAAEDEKTAQQRRFAWIEALRNPNEDILTATATELITQLGEDDVVDLHGQLFRPFVYRSIFRVLGIRGEDDPQLATALNVYVGFLDGRAGFTSGVQAAHALLTLVSRVAALNFQAAPGPLKCSGYSPAAWCNDLAFIIATAQESAAFLLGTIALYGLHPGDLGAGVRSYTGVFDSLLNEALRFDPPVQLVGRVALAEQRIGAMLVGKGQRVICHIGLAHRDEEEFPRPNDFAVTRPIQNLLAFGAGRHHCVGWALARRQVKSMLRVIGSFDQKISLQPGASYELTSSGREFGYIPARIH